jgi:peptidyl-prolyl cis-trans isomerase D
MLEKFGGGKVQGIVLGVIVVLLSLVFILQFGGPQAQGCSAARAGRFAAKVDGTTISEGDFRAAFVLANGDRYPAELARQSRLRELILDGLIERVLLAKEARALGFRVDEAEVMRRLAEDDMVLLSRSVNAPATFPGGRLRLGARGEDDKFDAQRAKNIIHFSLRRSVEEFAEAQVEEILAERMRDTLRATVAVSPEEVWDAYVREKERAVVDYVRFSPVYYKDSLRFTPAELDAWIAAHQAEVDAEYQRQRHRYTGLEKQVRARHILIKVAGDASDEVKAAARARIERLLARARAGEDFAALAREASEDPGSARRGGDLGYNPRGRMVAPFDEAQFSLQPGQISGIVESDFGFHVIKVEGVREGDVPEAEAKRELGENLYRAARSKELAREAAARALADLRGGASMEQLGERLLAEARAASGRPAPAAPQAGADAPAAPAEPEDPYAPRVQESRPFGRSDGPIPGPFDSTPLAQAAYELSMESPLPSEPLLLGEDYFVFRVKERTTATREDFPAADRQRIAEGLLATKQQEAIAAFVRRLRGRAEARGAIRVNDAVLAYPTAEAGDESASN